MKKYKLIMSDLDNTLLPIYTQERFAEIWMRDTAKIFARNGIEIKAAAEGVSRGIRAMLYNESGKKNIEVFYEKAQEISGYGKARLDPVIREYYRTDFRNIYDLTLPNPFAVQICRLMRRKARYTALATMPIFTEEAVEMRMSWVGLEPNMFDLITVADNSSYCKPNPKYFEEIMDRFGVSADETLMIGNDVREDMQPCRALGIDTFLVTDHIITHDLPYDGYRQGRYPELIEFLKRL